MRPTAPSLEAHVQFPARCRTGLLRGRWEFAACSLARRSATPTPLTATGDDVVTRRLDPLATFDPLSLCRLGIERNSRPPVDAHPSPRRLNDGSPLTRFYFFSAGFTLFWNVDFYVFVLLRPALFVGEMLNGTKQKKKKTTSIFRDGCFFYQLPKGGLEEMSGTV